MKTKQRVTNTNKEIKAVKQTKAEKVAQSKIINNINSGELAISNGKYIDNLKQAQLKRAASRPPAATLPLLMIIRLIKYISTNIKDDKPLTKIGITCAAVGDCATAIPYIDGNRDYISINKQQYHKASDIKELQGYLIGDDISNLIDGYIQVRGYTEAYKAVLINIDNNTPKVINDGLQMEINELNYRFSDENCINFSLILIKALNKLQEQRELDLYNKGRVADIFIHKSQYGWTDGPTSATTATTNNTINISGPQSSEFLKLLGYKKE